jgi:hypothetical protein
VKTTVDIPDTLFRKAKATAAERGVSLKDLLTEAVREHLQRSTRDSSKDKLSAPAWMSAFGGLRRPRPPHGRVVACTASDPLRTRRMYNEAY